jgi:YVTN family beta-propeller protein
MPLPPPPPPEPAPTIDSYRGLPPPPPPAPPAPPATPAGSPVKPRSARTAILVAAVLVVAIAGGGFYLLSRGAQAGVPLTTPLPSTVAVVHSGSAQLVLESLTGGVAKRTLQLPGAPDAILETPDRTRAFLLDTSHGDVIPVNLVSGHVGASIPVGKLPVDEEMSADGSTLYVTDNLSGTVIPINTTTDRLEPAQPLTQGVGFYVPSPVGSGALVGSHTSAGQPGVVYFYNPATGSGTPVQVGADRAASAFYSKNGATVWINESGTNSKPGVLIPVDVATHKPGVPIKVGVAPSAYALTPSGQTVVIANQADSTLSVIDLAKRAVTATIPVGVAPTGVAIDAAGTTAWVASGLDRKLVPVSLISDHAGAAVSLGNAPGDLALPAASGVAWVLFPSSNGSVNFLNGATGPLQGSIHVGNGPDLLVGTGSESSWVANALTNTVQRVNASGRSAGPAIPVFRTPSELKLTPDGSALLVLSYGDGVHSGALTSINTTTSKASSPINIGAAPGNLTLSPAGDIAFIADFHANAVVVIDVPNWKIKGVLPMPCGPTDLAITPDDSQLFVACADSSAILPVKLPDYTLETPVGVASVRGLVMPDTGTNLLVVGGNGLQTLDTATNRITKTVNESANLISVVETTDGRTILAVDNSGGALLLIDPVTLATRKSLAVGTRPDGVALSPDDAHAYVLDTGQQKLFVVAVSTWKIMVTLDVSPDATDVVVPAPVVVPPSA